MSDRTPDHPGTEASVVITTKNRREAVLRAVRSAVDQSGAIEVIVIDDGSTDGTSEAIQTAHPEVRLIRCDVSEGFVRQRNRGAAIATAPIVISLDDDAVFDGPDVVRGTLREFTDPRIAAVHMPAAGARTTERPHAVACFVGWAHAVRRDAFFAVGGYRGELRGYGEERDICIRMLQRGQFVVQGRTGGVTHHPFPNRNWRPVARLARRNDILHTWQNVPFPEVLAHGPGAVAKGTSIALRYGHIPDQAGGFAEGVRDCVMGRSRRAPVSRRVYHLFRDLGRPGGLPLEDAIARLGPPPAG